MEPRKWYRVEWFKNPLTGAEFDNRYHQEYFWPGYGGWGGLERAKVNFDLLTHALELRKETARVRLVERDSYADGKQHKGKSKHVLHEVEFAQGVKREVRRVE